MTQAPMPARSCRCERPVLDGESCVRCGRSLTLVPEPGFTPPGPRIAAWTPAGVIRAFQAFAFFRGRPPVHSDWARRMGDDWPALETVLSLFGSIEAAICAAGIEAPRAHAVGR